MHSSCVFDLDGTLVNSLEDLAISSNKALETLGFPVYETQRYPYFIGNGVSKLIERIIPEASRTPEILKMTRKLFDEYYNIHYLDNTAPYDGIPALLTQLREADIKLAVVSNKPNIFVKKIVAELFGDSFDCVIGQRDGIPRKPDPTAVLEVLSAMGVKPENCRYIGDSGVDMQTAKAAGATALGALWGFRTRDELLANGAQGLLEKPADLLKFI